jgi:hypothetical protein
MTNRAYAKKTKEMDFCVVFCGIVKSYTTQDVLLIRFSALLSFKPISREISTQTNVSPRELDKTLKSLVDVKLLLSSEVSYNP